MSESHAKAALSHDIEEKLLALSHEFKTPLSVTVSALQLLETKLENNHPDEYQADYKEFFDIATRNVYRTLRLTNNLIDTGRINRGFTKPMIQETDLTTLVREMTANVAVYGQMHGVSVSYMGMEMPLPVHCDAPMVERVLLNLLANALKAVPRHCGVIQIGLKQQENCAEITVTDNGCGIQEEDLPHIFEKYWYKTSKGFADKSGIGLGLYIAQNLTSLHGGTLWAQCPESGGSIFTVRLPLMPPASDNIIVFGSTAAEYQSAWQMALLQIEMVEFT
ncbi:MAG: HAMP domain-containing sensor histidine kinase [Ruthenibacterium sp.]